MQKIIFLFMTILFVSACGSKQTTVDIELNNGMKWKVNEEMKPHIEEGNTILTVYLENEGSDYKELAESLKIQNDKLIQSCNMKGKSHDELHKWLHPHMKLIRDLSKANNGQVAAPLIAQIEQSFKTYKNYFE